MTAWAGDHGDELFLDLMRGLPGTPHGTMDLLFVRMLQQARAEGYTWFNIGMSPLPPRYTKKAGLRDRIYAYARRHAEHFYNLEGLRTFKDKYNPRWSARHLVVRSRFDVIPSLVDLAVLTSGGGVRGLIGRTPQRAINTALRRLLEGASVPSRTE